MATPSRGTPCSHRVLLWARPSTWRYNWARPVRASTHQVVNLPWEKEISDHTVGLQHPERIHPPSGSASARWHADLCEDPDWQKPSLWKWSPQTPLKMWRPRFRINKAFPKTSSVLSLLASSSKMAALCLTTTSRRSPLSPWCCVSVVAAHFRLF